MAVSYEVLYRALDRGTKRVRSHSDMVAWLEEQGIEIDGFQALGERMAEVAVEDMAENDATLADALGGLFLSGFMCAWTFLRPGVADEAFEMMAQGDVVRVRAAEIVELE